MPGLEINSTRFLPFFRAIPGSSPRQGSRAMAIVEIVRDLCEKGFHIRFEQKSSI